MANLVNRLPIQDRQNSTQSVLLQLDPIWQAWIEKQSLDLRKLRQHSQIKNVENDTLILHCSSASYATLLRHHSASLLDTLRHAGFTSLNRITIRVEHPTQKIISDETKGKRKQPSAQVNSGLVSRSSVKRPTVKKSDLEAIQSAAETVDNQSLSQSLKRLVKTLRKRS